MRDANERAERMERYIDAYGGHGVQMSFEIADDFNASYTRTRF